MTALPHRPRRLLLAHGLRLAAGGLAIGAVPAWARSAEPRSLAFVHTHTGEDIELPFARGDHYLPEALAALNRFLRDHYSGEVGRIDPALFDLLHRTRDVLGSREPFEVISGYRAPATNERLRRQGGGGVARRSLHMDGRAIDVRLTGVALGDLRDAAITLQRGGVGYYERSRFVHLDTGRVRRW